MNVAMFAIPNENFQVCKKQATEMAKFAKQKTGFCGKNLWSYESAKKGKNRGRPGDRVIE